MSIFHLSMQVIGRSSGRSSTAAAAYRAACRIVDTRTGEVHDFTRKGGVRESFILAPESAPAWMNDRAQLWNGVEEAEDELNRKRNIAQLARELEVGLPHELPHDQRRQLLAEFITDEFVSRGMVADVAMHSPGKEGDRRNEHAHILLTLRVIDGNSFGKKERAWNEKELVEQWRASWAQHVNQALEANAISARIDHRSFERQALAADYDVTFASLPTVHLGPDASQLERRGVHTFPGNLNREIQVVNLELERARRAMRTNAERPPVPATATLREDDSAQRRERLQRELREALSLPMLPTASEILEAIRQRRDDLPAISERRLRESVALRAAAQRLEEANAAFRKLNERHDDLQARLAMLLNQADEHKAARKWREQNPLRAWFHDRGLFKSQVAEGVLDDPDEFQSQWTEAKEDWTQVEVQLVVAQEVRQDALRARVQAQEQVKQEVRQETQDVTRELDRAEVLANDLQQLENMEWRQREAAMSGPDAPRPLPELPMPGPAP